MLRERIRAAQAQIGTVREEASGTESRLAQVSEQLGKSRVVNPRRGHRPHHLRQPGEFVQGGAPAYKNRGPHTLTLRAYVSGAQLASVRIGGPVQVRIDAGRDQLATLPGRLSWVASQAEFTPTPIQTADERTDQVYAVKIRVPNRGGVLKIGMPGEVILPRAQRPGMSGAGARLPSTENAVSVDGVAKRFGEVAALDGISFHRRPRRDLRIHRAGRRGEDHLFRILTTLIVPDAGTARVLGLDVVRDLWALRSRVGYMPGRFSLYPDLSVEENLAFFASVFGTTIQAQYDLIAPIYRQIEPFKERRAGALSGGMKQKLALCCALVHRPDILFLDEPTTGVDAVSRREFWDLLGELRAGGLTIVVSTPYMEEAGRCDRVALIAGGRILDVDAPDAIGARYPSPCWRCAARALRADPGAAPPSARALRLPLRRRAALHG